MSALNDDKFRLPSSRGENPISAQEQEILTALVVVVTYGMMLQYLPIAGDGGLHSLEATGASASGDLWECRELDREAKVYCYRVGPCRRVMVPENGRKKTRNYYY